jgi:hypothetical protein
LSAAAAATAIGSAGVCGAGRGMEDVEGGCLAVRSARRKGRQAKGGAGPLPWRSASPAHCPTPRPFLPRRRRPRCMRCARRYVFSLFFFFSLVEGGTIDRVVDRGVRAFLRLRRGCPIRTAVTSALEPRASPRTLPSPFAPFSSSLCICTPRCRPEPSFASCHHCGGYRRVNSTFS